MDIRRTLKYLNDTGLTAEEHLLLYSIYVRNTNKSDSEFLKEMDKYYHRNGYYDPGGANIFMSWSTLVQKLARDEFIKLYPGYVYKDKEGKMVVDFTRIETTEKFEDTIYDKDLEKWWDHFKGIYGKNMYINGKVVDAWQDDPNDRIGLEGLKQIFWKRCGNGDRFQIGVFLENTYRYINKYGTSQKVITYLRNYELLMENFDEAVEHYK